MNFSFTLARAKGIFVLGIYWKSSISSKLTSNFGFSQKCCFNSKASPIPPKGDGNKPPLKDKNFWKEIMGHLPPPSSKEGEPVAGVVQNNILID
jgi:hypothetical protein